MQLICRRVCHTNGLGYSLFAAGIAARIGENVNPSVALLDRHVWSLLGDLEEAYLSARTPPSRQRSGLADGFAMLLLWLGWLRSSETFGASVGVILIWWNQRMVPRWTYLGDVASWTFALALKPRHLVRSPWIYFWPTRHCRATTLESGSIALVAARVLVRQTTKLVRFTSSFMPWGLHGRH
jgi:hypothetical protein